MRAADDFRGEKGDLREVFLHLSAMLHQIAESRWEEEQEGGKKKEVKCFFFSTWRFHMPAWPLPASLDPSFFCRGRLLVFFSASPAASSGRVNICGLLFMEAGPEDMERTLGESPGSACKKTISFCRRPLTGPVHARVCVWRFIQKMTYTKAHPLPVFYAHASMHSIANPFLFAHLFRCD